MYSLSLTLSFIFGAIVGSFLNVVSLRFNTGMTLGGRSKCMTCGTKLTWKELIPLLSFLHQKGACKTCKGKISWQYPLVEFVAGAVFVFIFLVFPPLSYESALQTLLHIVAACVLLVIAVYDIRHKIIPDRFSYAFAVVALLTLFFGGSSWWHLPSLWQVLAGPILVAPFAIIWAVSRGRWMGLGDAKLMLGIGWMTGISAGINALILSFWIAAAVSVVWLFMAYRRFKPKTEIPFGPYLILGMYLVILFQIQVIDIGLLKDILWSLF